MDCRENEEVEKLEPTDVGARAFITAAYKLGPKEPYSFLYSSISG